MWLSLYILHSDHDYGHIRIHLAQLLDFNVISYVFDFPPWRLVSFLTCLPGSPTLVAWLTIELARFLFSLFCCVAGACLFRSCTFLPSTSWTRTMSCLSRKALQPPDHIKIPIDCHNFWLFNNDFNCVFPHSEDRLRSQLNPCTYPTSRFQRDFKLGELSYLLALSLWREDRICSRRVEPSSSRGIYLGVEVVCPASTSEGNHIDQELKKKLNLGTWIFMWFK